MATPTRISSSSSAPSSSSANRREKDAMKLKKMGLVVQLVEKSLYHFKVEVHGPKDSPYHGFKWWVNVELPEDYPKVPPLVHFEDRVLHPNIDESSGHIAADFLDDAWNPDIELSAVILHYLPSLLMKPNAENPYNVAASELYLRDRKEYNDAVEEFAFQNARPV